MRIENFRGIRSLAWALDSRFVVLIGPGDAGKSTILDALALALSPSWRPALSDADFHNCDVTAPITIEATVADYPSTVGREDRFGHHISGVAADGTLQQLVGQGAHQRVTAADIAAAGRGWLVEVDA